MFNFSLGLLTLYVDVVRRKKNKEEKSRMVFLLLSHQGIGRIVGEHSKHTYAKQRHRKRTY